MTKLIDGVSDGTKSEFSAAPANIEVEEVVEEKTVVAPLFGTDSQESQEDSAEEEGEKTFSGKKVMWDSDVADN